MALFGAQARHAAPIIGLLLCVTLSYKTVAAHTASLDEAQAVLLAQLDEASPSSTVSTANSTPATYIGTHVIRTVSHIGGTDTLSHLLRTDNHGLLELDTSDLSHQLDRVPPGVQLRADGTLINSKKIHVSQFMVQRRNIRYMTHADGHEHTEDIANSGPDYAYLEALPTLEPWVQHRVVKEMTTLFMISSICGCDAATTVQELERVLFDQPGSKAKTLQSYYWECSQGTTYMNSSNSKVVGPIDIPCSYNSSSLSFSAQDCAFSDADGWIKYASMQAQEQYGVDLSLYRHRVLVMPMYYIYEAGCRWLGLGTLGPDETGPDGSYLYSSVWVTGEYWKQPIAFMHELGHTEYLHHSGEHGCVYCDYSCIMGDCCDSRCFNSVHNWQLGWGSPIALLNSTNLPVGVTLKYTLPTQQSASVNMLLIVPDWMDGYAAYPYGIFLGYRTESGRYDDDIPAEYLYATNIYTYDGQVQTATRYTWVVTNVGTGQEYRNATWQLAIKQVHSTHQAAEVTVCRWEQPHETSCHDGIDNDCDGLVDMQDPDCSTTSGTAYSPYSIAPRPPAPTAPPAPLAPMPPCDTQCPGIPDNPPPPAPPQPPSPTLTMSESTLPPDTQEQPITAPDVKQKHPPGWWKKHKKKPPPPPSLSQDTLAPPEPKQRINWGHFPPAPPEGVPIPKDIAWKYKKRAPPPPFPSSLPGMSKLEVQARDASTLISVAMQDDIITDIDSPDRAPTGYEWAYDDDLPHTPHGNLADQEYNDWQASKDDGHDGHAKAASSRQAHLPQELMTDVVGILEQQPPGPAPSPPPPPSPPGEGASVRLCEEGVTTSEQIECMIAAGGLVGKHDEGRDAVVDVDISVLRSAAQTKEWLLLGTEVNDMLGSLEGHSDAELLGGSEVQEGELLVDGEPVGVAYRDESLRYKFRLMRNPPNGQLRGERKRSRRG